MRRLVCIVVGVAVVLAEGNVTSSTVSGPVAASSFVKVARGAARLTDIAAIPVVDFGARVGYVGSIAPGGGNDDWNWGEVQDENGEWILFEDFGPGCIYNFTQHRGETVEVPVFRFYFDGEKTPRLTVRPRDFGNIAELPKPLADAFCAEEHKRPFRIVRSFVPMEYRTGCRITSSIALRGKSPNGGWGHVMYHHYDSAEGLVTYDSRRKIGPLAKVFEHPLGIKSTMQERTGCGGKVPPRSETELFTSSECGTLVETSLEFPSANPSMSTNIWLAYEFDGVRTVEAPIGTFFGCEMPTTRTHLKTALIAVDNTTSTLRLANRFPMPFFRSCRVVLMNRGTEPASYTVKIGVNRSLRYDPAKTGVFTASKYYSKTRNQMHQNARIGRLVGRGLMAYGTISGYDFAKSPWGVCEGDVRCFLDDMTVPRVQSDGSESWGSWGWGFCAGGSMNPFSYYDVLKEQHAGWSQLRLTYADAYNFRRFVRFDLEHGCANDHPESSSSGQIFGYVLR